MALLCDALEGTGAAAPPAARLMWSDVDPLLTRHGALPDDRVATRVARMRELFPDVRYIRVTRREKVRQAISAWRGGDGRPPPVGLGGPPQALPPPVWAGGGGARVLSRP